MTNGLGGYSSSTLAGHLTRRYHGLLVAALPAPVGRMVMLSHVEVRLRLPSGAELDIDRQPQAHAAQESSTAMRLSEFRLDLGLPVWRYEAQGLVLERRVVMPYRQNTVHLGYRLLEPPDEPIRLEFRPFLQVRHYEAHVQSDAFHGYAVTAIERKFEIAAGGDNPVLRLSFFDDTSGLTLAPREITVDYREEARRGYPHIGTLWSPGYFQTHLATERLDATLIASTDSWEVIEALTPGPALETETARRRHLLSLAPAAVCSDLGAELIVAADQFIATPAARPVDETRAVALGTEARTVIAGYHWFTDWGRDTMISLEGLTLVTGRSAEAALILRTFASYVRDGLIPNMFPDGRTEGLYHTADATLWFFHAVGRYFSITGDLSTLRTLLPVLREIVDIHLHGTRFGIGVDPADGLLMQGQQGYQLTWMDAVVNGWVVTPRRGKAVEINALFYNALRLLEGWLRMEHGDTGARGVADHADRLRDSFNRRFWYAEGGYLFDVVDGEAGDDPACRPNQLLALSLTHPVLDASRWSAVVETARRRLVTPWGLRSLAAGHPNYCPRYDGDVRARDAAYHQGTVWAWLIGPYVDAWLRVHPHDRDAARRQVEHFGSHLSEAGIGSISEIFDAEDPYTPRGCIAQAWSVAEVLRALSRLAEPDTGNGSAPP